MNVIGFLRSSIPMLVCIVGMYLFTVRRENCQMKFNICIVVVFSIEFLIYYFMFAEEAGTIGVPISKILTLLMISFLTFCGGLYVYGGWSRIGIYILATDLVLAIAERIYWAAWEALTHGAVEQSVIYYKGNTVVEWDSFPMYLLDCLLLVPFLIGGYKLRNRPLRPEWLFKTAVIIYLMLGGSPLIMRLGFEGGSGVQIFFSLLVLAVLLFFVIMTIHITAVRESRRIFYLRKQVVTEQSRLLMMQKEKVRRLRHDVKKHLSNLEYVLENEPDLCSDPSFQRYQEILNTNVEWMKGGFYCDSPIMNLCFEQMKRYCDDKGIGLDIGLKRLNFAVWTQEDQLMFGTLLLNLLELFGDNQSLAAAHFSGDNLMGQNILRITLESGAGGGRNYDGSQKHDEIQNRGDSQNLGGSQYRARSQNLNDSQEHGDSQILSGGQNHGFRRKQDVLSSKTSGRIPKETKLISNLEKDLRLVLSKYEGRMERADDGGYPAYVINWRDGKPAES